VHTDQKKLLVDALEKGMYISKLDRPWIETPFPLQGFYVRDSRDIELLRRFCREVWVDVARSRVEAAPVVHAIDEPKATVVAAGAASPASAATQAAVKRRQQVYRTTVSMPQEVSAANTLYEEMSRTIVEVFDGFRAGRALDMPAAQEKAAAMVDSVIRNPDAMVWLSRVRDADSYSYNHSLRCSIWAIVFGRHLGISKKTLDNLALGTLVMDLGKAKLPAGMLAKRGILNASERVELRRHVEYSLDIISAMPGMSEQVVQVIAEHHERYDGTGYPKQIAGRDISPLGKIAGLVDTYDAMTSERPYARAMTSVEAVSRLYELRGTEFQSQLVEEFIQAIGVYPTGSLVHLSSQEVGVVIAQNPDRRLRPKLLVLLDADKKALTKPRYLDMMATTQDNLGQPLRIITSLLPGAFGVDPARIQLAA
jgi:HD-GYP domain-containing protein (c-di-GMP phosphodiesterase class II)